MRHLLKLGVAFVLAAALLAAIGMTYRQAMYQAHLSAVARSAEAAVQLFDNAVAEALSVVDLVRARGHDNCSPASLKSLDELVFLSPALKAIVISSDGAACASTDYSSALVLSDLSAENGEMRADSAIKFHRVPGAFPGIGVSRSDAGTGAAIVGLVNASAYVAVTIEPGLVQEADAAFMLDSGVPIVTTPNFDQTENDVPQRSFQVASDLYPFYFIVRVPERALAPDYFPFGYWMPILVGLLGLLASWHLTVRYLIVDRPQDAIARAINKGEIKPYFQPIVDLSTGRIECFEVLSRWVKPDGHVVGPSEFIAEVERYSLSPLLIRSLVQQTGQAMRFLIDKHPKLDFAFNVAPDTFVQPHFAQGLLEALQTADLDAQRVIIEVTERQEMPDVSQGRCATAQLQELGIRVSIDDVGTGHNGLSIISAMAPNEIKIDKYFVDGLPNNPRSLSMMQMLVRTAHGLGMKTVAEGVENGEQVDALILLNVDYVQGYHLSRPLPPKAAIALFLKQQEHLDSAAAYNALTETVASEPGGEVPHLGAHAA